jgi:hypothetical protein
MPLNTVHEYLRRMLDGTQIPGTAGVLEAFITPPDPETEPTPKAYVWGSLADENRMASPRIPENGDITQAGWKQLDHKLDVWLVWFSDEDTDTRTISVAFPAVVDFVAKILRESPDPAKVADPLTGMESELLDIGERMTIDMYPPRATADQRILRYDAKFQLTILETFQS